MSRDPLRRLAEANPVREEDVRDAAESDHARRTLESILEEETGRAPTRRRSGLVALGAAAAVIAALLFAQLPAGRERRIAGPEDVLLRTARVAATSPLPVPGPGEYLYTRSEVTSRSTFRSGRADWTVLLPRVREVWLDADGRGRLREIPGRPVFPGPRDRRLWRTAGRPDLAGSIVERRIGPGEMLGGRALHLPEDPEALHGWLLRRAPSGLPQAVAPFVAASDLLGQPLADPGTRAALFRFLGGLEGVELLGTVEDPLGREGTGVAMTTRVFGALERRVLIFDPATSRVLADEVRVLHRVPWMDGSPPVLTDAHVHAVGGIVTSTGQRVSG